MRFVQIEFDTLEQKDKEGLSAGLDTFFFDDYKINNVTLKANAISS